MENPIQQRYERLVSQMAEVIGCAKADGYAVSYLPFYQGSDEGFIADVQQAMESDDPVLQRGLDYTLDNIDNLFSQYDAGLCMRFHSILLAVRNEVPCIAICYDHKSEQLLAEAGLTDYGIRYGIRKSGFFGVEQDIDSGRLKDIASIAFGEAPGFKERARAFAQHKHKQVLANYELIFSPL